MTRHIEVETVGGELDEDRLRRIAVRAYDLRNMAVAEQDALEPHDSETPTLVERYDSDDGDRAQLSFELHVGCGDTCGVLAVVPYDGNIGEAPREVAFAIAHAGRDLLDLIAEVRQLRARVADLDLDRRAGMDALAIVVGDVGRALEDVGAVRPDETDVDYADRIRELGDDLRNARRIARGEP
jgi:hypothetical protein